jgi:hypothetical protein
MEAVTRSLRSCYAVEVELVLVALVLVAWQAVRIPLEADVAISLAHAHDVLALERALSLDVEPWVMETVRPSAADALAWLYTNIHLPVLFGFMAAARLLAPDRYPIVRTTFALSFVPAVLVIGLYPLAPPYWLPEFGLGGPPSDAELSSTTGTLLHNSTAAAASQHFGFAVLVAATSIWLFPRSRLAWATLSYPALVFTVIVGTGNHYVLDCVVGTLTFALAALAASYLHRHRPAVESPSRPAGIASIAVGYALVTWGFVSLDLMELRTWEDLFPDVIVLLAGIALVIAPRLGSRELVPENG